MSQKRIVIYLILPDVRLIPMTQIQMILKRITTISKDIDLYHLDHHPVSKARQSFHLLTHCEVGA